MTDRPKAFQNRKKERYDEYTTTKAQKFQMAHDNIYHMRVLMDEIFRKQDLFNMDTNEDAQSQAHWIIKRMIAVLAVTYGCVSEGSLWLPIMDRLLEDLARRVVGHVDHNFETVRFQKLAALLAGNMEHERSLKMSNTVIKRLEKEHRARRLSSELAVFYRGSVYLVCAAACKHASSQVSSARTKEWYEQLLGWSSRCPHPGCVEQLVAEFHPDARTQKWGVSVGVKDVRLGSPDVR